MNIKQAKKLLEENGYKVEEPIKDYIEIKDFRIYKWSKPVKNFPMPKGFVMSEFKEFVDLIDNGFELDKGAYYFVKHFSKLQQKKEYCLSGLYLDRNLDLYSGNGGLAYSGENGRVVVRKIK